MKVIKVRTEMTANIRRCIREAGIKANIRNLPGHDLGIQVYTTGPHVEFTEAEQRQIRQIAVNNGLTAVRGLPIDIERMTDPHSMNFYMTVEGAVEMRGRIERCPNPYQRPHAAPN
jgi:hypothetical protein